MSASVSRTQFPKEVATALGISVDTVARYAREGIIPFEVTPKGHRRYDIDEVRDAVCLDTVKDPSAAGSISNTSRQEACRWAGGAGKSTMRS